jgi:hypothetical protein
MLAGATTRLSLELYEYAQPSLNTFRINRTKVSTSIHVFIEQNRHRK